MWEENQTKHVADLMYSFVPDAMNHLPYLEGDLIWEISAANLDTHTKHLTTY